MHQTSSSSSPPPPSQTPRSLSLRAVNASLESILLAGMKPVVRDVRPGGREYFQFRNGQIRRQIGHGHSKAERRARHTIRQLARRAVLPAGKSIGDLAAALIARQFAVSAA